MKLILLCGSLELGKDGVGDYTRRLAVELIRQGHLVGIIAISDRYVSAQFLGTQLSECINIPVLRISFKFSVSERFRMAKGWIDDFDPNYLSLQFVPFTFQRKGLPFRLSKHLKYIAGGRNWHIMFHELWVGMDKNASIKLKLWGFVQRVLIVKMIKAISPKLIHTQSKIYVTQLTKLGFEVRYLPLFSNIPIVQSFTKLEAKYNHPNQTDLVIFGTIHPGAPVKEMVKEALIYQQEHRATIVLRIIGRISEQQEIWANAFRSANILVDLVGEQSTESVSKILSESTVGISTTAYAMIEKSGSVATMLGHALSVICVAAPLAPSGLVVAPPPSGIYEFSPGCIAECVSANRNFSSRYQVGNIAEQFVKDISSSF